MASSSSVPKYDVYLSVQARDYHSPFVSYLCTKLEEAKINYATSVSVPEMENQLVPSDWIAISQSRICAIVFSSNYASSMSSLQDLQHILKCDRIVLPLFYDVDPFEVSNQTGRFGRAFDDLISRALIYQDHELSLRTALSTAVDHSSHHMRDFRNEREYIDKIVEEVNHSLGKVDLNVPLVHPLGVKARVQDAIRQLKVNQSKDVLLLGIWGISGIGKTIIAKAIYDKIGSDFEGRSFLANIREVWEQITSPIYLQQQLLFSIYTAIGTRIKSIESGKAILEENLCRKRILVVLDDVNKLEQLDTLCGSRKWFGSGSRIIITTRDKHLLKVHGIENVYSIKEMDKSESIELFSWHAFKQKSPIKDFAILTGNVASYCGGLPLALEVLGSELHGKEIKSWENIWNELKSYPIPSVHQILERNFDGLKDNEKEIFCEIARFFIGNDRNDLIQILKGSGLDAESGVSVLIDRGLVTIDKKNKLGMHVLLKRMGREIVREGSQKKNESGIFDVFLSFRGKDTRSSFTSHLYASLENAGIYVFKDDEELPRGERISTSLLQAIKRSRISIIVFSKDYASSRWCLIELEKIMECNRITSMMVLPVFYDVDPSEVRHQSGMFGEGFKDLLKKISVKKVQEQSWRRVLHEAGGLSGIVIIDSRNESEDIKNIVELVTRSLDKTDLFVAAHPVGVEPRVQDVIQLLNNQQSKDVLLLGIWGMGGVGKTTIAKAIYNQIGRNFEGRSFLLNIREVWEQNTHQVELQERLLSDIYKTTKIKIHSIESGKSELKKRLHHKSILIVIDDVNKLEQLNALAGSREWFGPRSVIIITTRDEHLLRVHRVNHVYKMEGIDESESIELFSWHAFKQASAREDFASLSRNVVAYCEGLPLALEVIGSYLFDREITEWKSVLEKLKRIPNDEVHEKLKISFDGLSDFTMKEIFLDIACFLIGMDRNDAIQILNGCGLFADIGISVLIQRSLVIVDNKNKIGMHQLLRDMGREIIREKSPKELGKRSRLWFHEDARGVLSKHTGTEAVEGLALKLERSNTICLGTEAFKNMDGLRLLQLAAVQLVGDFGYISRDLRWLCWNGFPLVYTPPNFYQGSLVAIELQYSHLKLVWKEAQLMEKLKILNLSHSQYLTQTPDFSYLPNLEKLLLKDCPSLSRISHSIGCLNKLVLINLKDCTSLVRLPRSIYTLKSLKTLALSGCSRICKLEEDLEQMESLTTLVADNTAITQVPFSVVRSKICYISLCGYEGFSRDVFPSLIWSWMSPRHSLSSQVQSFAGMSFLVSIDLPSSSSHAISSIFNDLPKLQSLWFESGSELQLTQDVKGILDALYVTNCMELVATPSTLPILNMKTSASIDCPSIHSSRSRNIEQSLVIQMGKNSQVTGVLGETILQSTNGLPDDNYPDWLTFDGEGFSVIFEVPQMTERELKGMTLCIVVSSPNMTTQECLRNVLIINHTKATIQVYKRDTLTSFEGEEWQSVISNMEPGNKVEVLVVVFGYGFEVKKTAIYLVYGETTEDEIEQWHSPNGNVLASGDVDDENVQTIWIPPQVDPTASITQLDSIADVTQEVEKRRNKKTCGLCFSACMGFVSCGRDTKTEGEIEKQ